MGLLGKSSSAVGEFRVEFLAGSRRGDAPQIFGPGGIIQGQFRPLHVCVFCGSLG
jgi:hypothetical protein